MIAKLSSRYLHLQRLYLDAHCWKPQARVWYTIQYWFQKAPRLSVWCSVQKAETTNQQQGTPTGEQKERVWCSCRSNRVDSVS